MRGAFAGAILIPSDLIGSLPERKAMATCHKCVYSENAVGRNTSTINFSRSFFGELNVDRGRPSRREHSERAASNDLQAGIVHVHVTVLGHSEGTLSNRIFNTGSLGNWILWLHSLHHSAGTAAGQADHFCGQKSLEKLFCVVDVQSITLCRYDSEYSKARSKLDQRKR